MNGFIDVLSYQIKKLKRPTILECFYRGLHVIPNIEVGTIGVIAENGTAAVDRFIIDVVGIGCHAAHPNEGIDPRFAVDKGALIHSARLFSALASNALIKLSTEM